MPSRGDLQRLLLGALALMLTAAAMVTSPSIAQAAVTAPRSLSPDGAPQSDVPALAWAPVGGASRYEVQASASPTFDSVVVNTSTDNTRYTPTVQLPSPTVYWRVRSISATGVSSSWATASFGRGEQAAPTPQSPADGALLDQPSNPPVLTWSPIANASGYQVSIDDDRDFVGATTDNTRTTSYLVPNTQPAVTFWWRVRAERGPGLYTQWSNPRSYTVGGLPEVVPSLPVEHERVEDVVFDWTAVPGAKDYELRVSPDQDFNTLVPGTPIVVRGTRYSPPTTYGNDEYYWQVRARDNAGNSIPWTDTRVPVRHFQRIWEDAPIQTYPASSVSTTVGDPLFFEWTPVDHASRYELQMGQNQNFSPGTFATCFTRSTTFTPGVHNPWTQGTLGCTPQQGQVYYWRVRGLDEPANVPGLWSSVRAFVYDPGLVTPTAPENGAMVDIPTLSWNASREAEKYRVEVRNNAGGVVASAETYALSWTPSSRLDPAQGPFRWNVTSIDADGHRSASRMIEDQWTFRLSTATPPAGQAPLTPLGGTQVTARFPTLSWEPEPEATYYKVFVGVAGAPGLTELPSTYAYPAMSDTDKTYLDTGSYDWLVEAWGPKGYIARSPHRGTFTIKDLPPVTGQRVALTGTSMEKNACDNRLGATSGPQECADLLQTPVLDWDPSPEASHYMVYIAKDRELTNPVSGLAPYVTTQNTRLSLLELLPDSQAGDAYFWFVRPCKAFDRCAPDPTAKANSATHAFDKTSAPVELMSPVAAPDGTPPNVPNEVTLRWKDNLAKVQTQPQVLKNGGTVSTQATVEAAQYRVQVDVDPAFKNPYVNELVDQTTYTPYSGTLPEGPLYWRVQAVDGSGNSLTWSETGVIDKRSPKVALLAPADTGLVDGTPYFQWEPQTFASGYQIEVYKDNDTTLSPGNQVISATTRQPAFAPTEPLQVSQKSYLWRVRRVDADNRPGPWSTVRAFRVNGNAPDMATPASSQYVSSKQSYFAWQEVPGAARYRFERRPAGSPFDTEDVWTYALSWAPQTDITDGSWEWRVSSIDVQGRVMGASPWRPFSVDSTRPAVTKKQPRAGARRDANWVVTFSEPVRRVNTTTVKLYRAGSTKPLGARITSSNGGRTWTLNPSSSMTRGVRYTLKLSSGITDRAGNTLAATSYSCTPR